MPKHFDTDLEILIMGILHRRGAGVGSSIPLSELTDEAISFFRRKISPYELREGVRSLRLKGQPICSSPEGYFFPACLSEVQNTVDRVFRQPALSELRIGRALLEGGQRFFGYQDKLPAMEDLIFAISMETEKGRRE